MNRERQVEGEGTVATGDRPSRHGAILGRALAAISDAGRTVDPGIPPCCLTCAFRDGCMTNQMAGTGMIALKCSIGVDDSPFGCHHGLKGGEPSRLCAGYVAAKAAPFATVKAILVAMQVELDAQAGEDEVRTRFDTWLAAHDPDGVLDVYGLARAYERFAPAQNEGVGS